MLKRTFAAVVVAAALSAAACSDGDARLTPSGPQALRENNNWVAPAPFVGITSSVLSAQLIDNFVACPAIQPFLVTANIVVRADGDAPVFIDRVRIRFTDTSGFAAPEVTLTAPVPTRPFGSALVEARSARTFPVDFRFGCGTGRQGTIVFITDTRTDGRNFTDEFRATVR